MANYIDQIVLRRDGTVAKVSNVSDGWLIFNGSVDDSALPDEVLVIDFSCSDDEIRKIAYEFGVDRLQAERVPELARAQLVRSDYAYAAGQVIEHPIVEKSYLTILGINEAGLYKTSMKPEKGSAYEILLTEQSVRKFEREGVLPVKSELHFEVGAVVRLGKGDRVVILDGKTDKEWQILDPVTDAIEFIPLDESLFPTSETVQATILALRDARRNEIASHGTLNKTIDSLRAENNSLHKQLDGVQASQMDSERETLQKQLQLEKKAHDSTSQKLNAAIEDAATVRLSLLKLQREHVPSAGASLNSAAPAMQCKIIQNTGEAIFEKMWAEGWTCEHMQFSHNGTVMTVWKKVNAPAPAPNGRLAAYAVSEDDDTEEIVDVVEVANSGFAPVGMGTKPVPVTPTANQIQLGKYGTALLQHGLEKTKEAMDAEVTLAGHYASNPLIERPITLFLPESKVMVQS